MRLLSPIVTTTAARAVTFYRFMQFKSSNDPVELNVYLADFHGVEIQKIYGKEAAKGSSSGWVKEVTCTFGKGTYTIVFEAITGEFMGSDIAIDEISLVLSNERDIKCPEPKGEILKKKEQGYCLLFISY